MNKKKIGYVISYEDGHNNYGSSLQAYALLKKIKDLGYDVEIIRYITKRTAFDKIVLLYKMVQCYETKHKFMLLKKKLFLMFNEKYKRYENVRTKSVNLFKEEFIIPYFRVCIGYLELQNCSALYDTVIVGSDQVWSPLSLYSKFTNLLFVDDKTPKISYASSFGVSKIPKIQLKETASYLNRFNYISTRETSGKEIIESISDKKAEVVADPTLLMTSNEWIDFIKDVKNEISEPYIFCYLLGRNEGYRDEILKLQKKTGLKIVAIRHIDEFIKIDEKFGDYAPYNVGPKEFLKYIQNAEYVCTDSFHCTVFSLQFKRNFMTFYRYSNVSLQSRNTRIDSVLSITGLTNRIYSGNIFEISNPIEYNLVNEKLDMLRSSSYNFLANSIKKATYNS